MKWLRTWGLAVFVGLVVLVVLFWVLLIDWIVERTVEEVGTEIVGARVDLESADVGFAPISIALFGLQVTNPSAPMTNAVEVRRIAAGVDGTPLLFRKVHIDELAVEGVRFGTPRQSSGAVMRRSEKLARDTARAAEEIVELPSFERPDVEAILASEELESLAVIQEARVEVDAIVERWQQRLAALPDEERLRGYQARFEKLGAAGGAAGALGSAQEVLSLQKEVKQDLAVLQEAAGALESDMQRVQALAKRAAEAPAADVRRLQEKYGLSPQGLTNLSRRLLGPRVAELVASALSWWQRLEPLVARMEAAPESAEDTAAQPVENLRGRGVDVRFPETHPTPDFLIRTADVSVELDAGRFAGTIRDITPDQPIHGKPLTLAFSGDDLQGLERVSLTGTLDRVDPQRARDDLSLAIAGYSVERLPLSDSEQWGVAVERGTVDFTAKATRNDEQIQADASLSLVEAVLTTDFAQSGPVPDAIAETLTGVRSFALDARVRGTLDRYDLSVSSDLDGLLQQAVTRLVSRQMQDIQRRLTEEVTAKTAGPLDALGGEVASMGGIADRVTDRIQLGQGVLAEGAASGAGVKLPGGVKLPF